MSLSLSLSIYIYIYIYIWFNPPRPLGLRACRPRILSYQTPIPSPWGGVYPSPYPTEELSPLYGPPLGTRRGLPMRTKDPQRPQKPARKPPKAPQIPPRGQKGLGSFFPVATRPLFRPSEVPQTLYFTIQNACRPKPLFEPSSPGAVILLRGRGSPAI